MEKVDSTFDSLSFLIFSMVLVGVFYLSLIMPIIGDYWGYYLLNHDSGRGLAEVWDSTKKAYLGGNPRSGQVLLHIAGFSRFHSAIISVGSLLLTIYAGFYLMTGQLFSPRNRSAVIFALLVVGVQHLIGSRMGHAYFYAPFTTNYFAAFAGLLGFLAFVRATQFTPSFWKWPVAAMLGLFAGMSNEHTVPGFLGFGLLYLILSLFIRKEHSVRAFAYSIYCYLILFFSYVALYFAPGQSKRYSEIKNDGFSDLIANFGERFEQISGLLFDKAWPMYVVATVLLLFVIWRRGLKEGQIWSLVFLVAGIGIAYTTLASPKVGPRLMFGSHTMLALVFAGSIYTLRDRKWVLYSAGLFGTILTADFFYKTANATTEYKAEFEYQKLVVETQKMNGQLDVVAPFFGIDFRAKDDLIRKESYITDPDHRINKLRARYYGVDSFRFEEKDD